VKNILYPTDFSELSRCALAYAVYLAERCRAALHCIHVVDDRYQYWLTFDLATVPAGPPLDDLLAAAEKELTKFLNGQVPGDVEVKTGILRGSPFVEIIGYARDAGIDLIVIGTHGRSALRQVLMGSVADRVVHKSPCPVLTVRHSEHPFEMP